MSGNVAQTDGGKARGTWVNGTFRYTVMSFFVKVVPLNHCPEITTDHQREVSKVDRGCFHPGKTAHAYNIRT